MRGYFVAIAAEKIIELQTSQQHREEKHWWLQTSKQHCYEKTSKKGQQNKVAAVDVHAVVQLPLPFHLSSTVQLTGTLSLSPRLQVSDLNILIQLSTATCPFLPGSAEGSLLNQSKKEAAVTKKILRVLTAWVLLHFKPSCGFFDSWLRLGASDICLEAGYFGGTASQQHPGLEHAGHS